MAHNRINKINDQILRELGGIIRELKDIRIPLMTSVVSVNATPDLHYAKVYISVMGDEAVQKKALEGLKAAAGYVRHELGSRMELRNTPEILFELDHSIETGARINKVLQDIIKKEGE